MRVGHRSQLRRGDDVELRSPAEILATLDEQGCLEGVPFMPEMLQYFGARHTVTARVERACDTINPVSVRRMPDTVLLDDLRCDGSAHDGCDAGCRLYWKEAWLRQVPADGPVDVAPNGSLVALDERVRANTNATRDENGSEKEVYRCQATEFPRATQPLKWYDTSSFTRELTCGNVGVWRWLQVTMRAALYAFGTKLGLRLTGPIHPRSNVPESGVGNLELQAGDRARVGSQVEIEQTLDPSGKTRGLWFDREMLPYCGKTYTVKRPVRRFIDEASGEMIELKTDAVILDGVICQGYDSIGRWFCPRAIYPWWRECWLHKADDDESSSDS